MKQIILYSIIILASIGFVLAGTTMTAVEVPDKDIPRADKIILADKGMNDFETSKLRLCGGFDIIKNGTEIYTYSIPRYKFETFVKYENKKLNIKRYSNRRVEYDSKELEALKYNKIIDNMKYLASVYRDNSRANEPIGKEDKYTLSKAGVTP